VSVRAYRDDRHHGRLVIVVGLGLVGLEVCAQLAQHFVKVKSYGRTVKVDWNDPTKMNEILSSIVSINNAKNIELIWCAGKAGFSATEEQMKAEFFYFQQVIEALLLVSNHSLFVSLVSSAGGLYENSGLVSDVNDISPSRPYAFWKIKQEELLVQLGVNSRIFRAASIYGFHQGGRSGLVNVLINSAMYGRVARIFSNQDTLRDYVFNVDLARLITRRVVDNGAEHVSLVATGRPTSIAMLVNYIQRLGKRKISVTYLSNHSNEQDILFAPHAIDPELQISSLEEGLRITCKRMSLSG